MSDLAQWEEDDLADQAEAEPDDSTAEWKEDTASFYDQEPIDISEDDLDLPSPGDETSKF